MVATRRTPTLDSFAIYSSFFILHMSLLIYFWLYRNNHTTLQPKIARHFIKSIKVMFLAIMEL